LSRTASSAAKPVALARIDTEEQILDLKLKLKGRLASDLAAYQKAYAEAHGHAVDLEVIAPQMLASFMATDRGFQGWLKRHSQDVGRS
jgi:hypothetical protein